MTILATVNKSTFIYLQSLGKAFASTAISMVREVVFGVGLALLLPQFFGLNGVLYSMPMTFAICCAVIVYTCRTLDTGARRDLRLPRQEGVCIAVVSKRAEDFSKAHASLSLHEARLSANSSLLTIG